MKKTVVFISPVIPSFGGGGLAMRAAHNLKALAESFDVYLVVISIYGGAGGEPEPEILQLCREWYLVVARDPHGDESWTGRFYHWLRWGQPGVPPEWNSWEPGKGEEVEKILTKIKPYRIWVFRFYLLPWVWKWTKGGKGVWLDIDECESSSRRRQAALLEKVGKTSLARDLKNVATAYLLMERRWLDRLDKVVVASAIETSHLRNAGYEGLTEVWPNVISSGLSGGPVEAAPPGQDIYRLFFVGSMGHFPNRDAVVYAAKEILPLLSAILDKPVTFLVAGAGSSAYRNEIELPGVECLGEVADLEPYYALADLVLVPLRAGSGSRIKILEAFSHGRAVVSTSIGAEGLEVEDGKHLILSDDPETLALRCAELLKDENKRSNLARAGTDYLKGRHGFEVLKKRAACLAVEMDL